MMLLSASSRLRTSDELSFILRQQARKAFQELQAAVEDLAAACNDEEALDVNLSAKILEHKSLSRGECFLWNFWMHFYFCLTFFQDRCFYWCHCTTPQFATGLPVCKMIWNMSSGYKALCFCPWPAGMLLLLQCFSLTSSFRKIIGMTVTGASINAPLLAQIKPDVVTGWYYHWEAGGIWGIAGIWLQT